MARTSPVGSLQESDTPPSPPWAALPPELAEVLRPVLPALSDEIIAAIRREVSAYRRPLAGAFGRNVRLGTERALSRFLDLIADRDHHAYASRQTYIELGRGEFREGRSLDALMAAYRLGARIAWRRFAAAGDAAAVEPAVMYRLGEAVFAYIDGISTESAEGYAEAQSAAAGERQRRRRALVGMLRQQPPPDEGTMRRAAADAGWQLPRQLAALVTSAGQEGRLATRLGSDALAAVFDDVSVAIVPDPDGPGRRAALEAALEGRAAALGPTATPRDAARSIARAQLAYALQRKGVLPDDGLLAAHEHLLELVINGDRSLASDLADRYLAPLEALNGGARAKLERTLRAWLDLRGRIEEVAHRLDVHPQTVRYRLGQLRELYGNRLEDPEERLALALALRAAPPGAAG